MSHYDWEQGTLTLPSAEIPALKKTLRDWTNRLHDEVRAEAIRIHKHIAKATRSRDLYERRLREAQEARWQSRVRADARTEFVHQVARHVVDRMLYATRGGAPRQPNLTDVNQVVAKKTNRDNVFGVLTDEGYEEATIAFDGRKVTWGVMENNHAVERAHAAPMAGVFFAALNRITWTRGTGGVFVGNDEYNRDAEHAGGGGNYITAEYGPLGDEEKVHDWMSRGFSRKQARQMVADAKRPQRSSYGLAYGSRW